MHSNKKVEDAAIEALKWLQLGNDMNFLNDLREAYESEEEYEYCQGINLGIEIYDTKEFGCRVSDVYFELDKEDND